MIVLLCLSLAKLELAQALIVLSLLDFGAVDDALQSKLFAFQRRNPRHRYKSFFNERRQRIEFFCHANQRRYARCIIQLVLLDIFANLIDLRLRDA